MAVVKRPYVFCEGTENSLDELLLRPIALPAGLFLKPIGSKYGLNDRIDGFLQGHGVTDVRQVRYLALRDRDLDYVPPDECALIKAHHRRPIFATYRACIESYLIDAELIYEYWQYRYLGTQERPAEPLPVETIAERIEDAARTIADYQAVRWGLASIKYWPRPRTSWKERDGVLPQPLDFQGCLQAARNYFQENYQRPMVEMRWEVVHSKAQEYQAVFSSPEFYADQHYLVWFHGKDLIKAVFRALQEVEHLRKQYETWAVQRLDFRQHTDLNEFSQICRELTH